MGTLYCMQDCKVVLYSLTSKRRECLIISIIYNVKPRCFFLCGCAGKGNDPIIDRVICVTNKEQSPGRGE